LGVQVEEKGVLPLMSLARPLPSVRMFTTLNDNQNRALFHFLVRTKDSPGWYSAGRVFMDGLAPAPAGEPTLELKLTPRGSRNVLIEIEDRGSGAKRRMVLLPQGGGQPAGSGLVGRPEGGVVRPGEGVTLLPEKKAGRPLPGATRALRAVLVALAALAAAVIAGLLLFAPPRLREIAPRLFSREAMEAATPPEAAGPPGATPSVPSPEAGQPSRREAERPTGEETFALPEPGQQPQRRQPASQQEAKGPGGGGVRPEAPSYRVQWGDTLWRITERYYGDGDLYPLLAVENNITDPDVIIGGQDIRLPRKIDDRARIDTR
jgi:hypothetical protein